MLQLKTELGEVQPYSDYGSRLVEYRHEDKFDKANLHEIKQSSTVLSTLHYTIHLLHLMSMIIKLWHGIIFILRLLIKELERF